MTRSGNRHSRAAAFLLSLPWTGRVALAVFAFSILTVVPLAVFEYGGDIMFQYVAMDCFGSQLWAGNWYPRWCFDANAGLGSPVFLYYPPLPFYVSSLFYPLTWLGISLPHLYLLCLGLATFAGGMTAWWWLSDLTTPKKALLLALVTLWLPYRMEVMMFRSAYGELWCLAWMPLVFKYSRRLALGQRRALPKLALAFALCFLSNMPAAVIGVLASGGYSLLMMRKETWRRLAHYGLAVLWGALLSALYLGPAIMASGYITTEGVISGHRSWSNDFLSMANVTQHGQGHVVITIVLMLLAMAGLIGACCWRRHRADALTRREITSWSILALGAAFMMFPISKPLWDHMGFIRMLAFPWRMQLVMMLAAVALGAILLNGVPGQERPLPRRGDMGLLFFLLGLMGLFVISTRAPEFVAYGDKIRASQFITQREYRTIWTARKYITLPYIMQRYEQGARIPKLKRLRGNMGAQILRWQTGQIIMTVQAETPSLVRLDLQYFPLWEVDSLRAGIKTRPERGSGQLLLQLPKGNYELILRPSLIHMLGGGYVLSFAASLLSTLCLVYYGWVMPDRIKSLKAFAKKAGKLRIFRYI